jgi:chaperone BCS1
MILDILKNFIQNFSDYSKEYPIISGSLSLWFLGTSTWLLKSLPHNIMDFLKRNLTTELTLVSTGDSFHLFLKWFQENNFSNNSRTIKISNGRWGSDDMIKAMGYGNHYFIFNRTIIKLSLSMLDSSASEIIKDQIQMRILGRSHKTFDKIFEAIKDKDLDKDKIIIHKFNDHWYRASEQRTRSLDSIYLNYGVKETIINFIKSFREREKFNLYHGINHQTAIMLYGPPGTGKTSLIKAIATYFNLKIFYLNASSLSKIEIAFSSLPENSLVVIEDIDSDKILHNRGEEIVEVSGLNHVSNLEITKKQAVSIDDSFFSFTNLSDVLNAIDGLHCSHGRILLATTNHLEKLDPALIRSGRFDLKIKIDYADNYVVEQFIDKFYPDKLIPKNFKIKSNLPSSDIQNIVLKNLNNYENFIKEISQKENSKHENIH